MVSAPDRRKIVTLIDTARRDGAHLVPACKGAGIDVRTYQRWTKDGEVKSDKRPVVSRPAPANKLTPEERQSVLDTCHHPAYASMPPGQIVPRLADQGCYLASESSFYRILHEKDEQHHRGRNAKPHRHSPPQGYCATGPNQVWSWDITWLPSPIRGLYFYLYMIVDIYSRKVVGWEVHPIESVDFAAKLLHKAILAEGCLLDPPVLHADNGGPQKGITMKAKLESLFRTFKYRPEYPVKGFDSIDCARKWVRGGSYGGIMRSISTA